MPRVQHGLTTLKLTREEFELISVALIATAVAKRTERDALPEGHQGRKMLHDWANEFSDLYSKLNR